MESPVARYLYSKYIYIIIVWYVEDKIIIMELRHEFMHVAVRIPQCNGQSFSR